jgi:hypothetical protein
MQQDPTSDDVDRLLADDPTAGKRLAPQPAVRVHLEVSVDRSTLALLEQRAEREGRALSDVASDAVRAGATAA